MRRLALILLIFAAVFASAAQTNDGSSVSVTCPDGREITNAVEIIVNMRPGFTYTATAIGVDGFDPVMAVADRGGVRGCSDDASGAVGYAVNLPTTGPVQASRLSAQLPFSHNFESFEDISIIVGGFGGMTGEFVLVLEGMAVTNLDGDGDPFFLRLTGNMVNAATDSAVYMVATTSALDPLMRLTDADRNDLITCDDAGSSQFCEDEGAVDLSPYSIVRDGRETPANPRNTMLNLPTTQLTDVDLSQDNFFNFLMTTFEQRTTGDYVVAFHVGIGDPTGAGGTGGKLDDTNDAGGGKLDDVDSTEPDTTITGLSGGVSVTCPDGREITNAVEIIVNMRPGFTYTATALGVDGFDPVMAVVDSGVAIGCSDDNTDAAAYEAELPTTGRVVPSRFNAQLPFSHSYESFADLSLVVGGFEGAPGEFVLVLEGMAVTNLDGDGDPFTVRLTPNMVGSGVDLTTYMFQVDTSVDPLVRLVDGEGAVVLECDDAGNDSICAPGSSSLAASFVSRTNNRVTPGANNNAMLVVAMQDFATLDFSNDWFLNYLMTSFGSTQGEYAVAFHVGIGGDLK